MVGSGSVSRARNRAYTAPLSFDKLLSNEATYVELGTLVCLLARRSLRDATVQAVQVSFNGSIKRSARTLLLWDVPNAHQTQHELELCRWLGGEAHISDQRFSELIKEAYIGKRRLRRRQCNHLQ